MSVTVEELLAVLAEVARGPSPPVLVGGLAVHLRTRVERTIMHPDEAVADPVLLASVVRPTQDIDVAIPRPRLRSLAMRLGELHFTADSGQARRYRRERIGVDVLTPEVPFTGLALVEGNSSPVPLPDGTLSSPVATLDALVVTKSHAFVTREADRDLVDVGRLALRDLRDARLPPRLAQLLGEEGQVFELFAAVRQEFRSSDRYGPSAFFQAVLDASAGVHAAEWLARESDVRELVAMAVQQMFRDCDLDGD